ncbi:alpha/beta fold hydrolase [Frondihabitans sp. PAMC 28766]|uniref:alpha/beta fold hydrolase n=1 Tax=Frondihabitans sp. PAMC 28766 TaxID=1795630 RepID=UPI0009E6A7AE|nr:alpha/beta hydrolase [Frondihabitans sp. PAMC 28766]
MKQILNPSSTSGSKRPAIFTIVGASVAALGLALAGTVVAAAGSATAAPASVAAKTPGVVKQLEAATPKGSSKPTVVLVHGAWADTSSWDGEVTYLQDAGYPVRAIANPVENLTTDSEYVKDFLDSIKGPIVLVGHSYGGSVITNAAYGDKEVKALVYVDAAAPATGETNGSLSGSDSILSKDPASTLFTSVPEPGAPAGVDDIYLNEPIFVNYFGADLPKGQAEQLWATQRSASTAAFNTPSKYEAWKTIPSWFFISTGDKIITPTSEEAMAKRAHSTVTLFHGGSHLTLISHPAAVTAVIASAIKATSH